MPDSSKIGRHASLFYTEFHAGRAMWQRKSILHDPALGVLKDTRAFLTDEDIPVLGPVASLQPEKYVSLNKALQP